MRYQPSLTPDIPLRHFVWLPPLVHLNVHVLTSGQEDSQPVLGLSMREARCMADLAGMVMAV